MNTPTTALSLDSIAAVAAVVAIAPLVLAAFAALTFMLTAKLIFALVASGFES